MYIKMLEAVSEMLDPFKPSTESSKTQDRMGVQCAKLMLDKIIEGMKGDPTPQAVETFKEQVDIASTIDVPKQPKQPKNAISLEVNDKRKIVCVHNALPDTIIELDGKRYSPAEAIGMTFTKGNIL